jgi:hypothetical protein
MDHVAVTVSDKTAYSTGHQTYSQVKNRKNWESVLANFIY